MRLVELDAQCLGAFLESCFALGLTKILAARVGGVSVQDMKLSADACYAWPTLVWIGLKSGKLCGS